MLLRCHSCRALFPCRHAPPCRHALFHAVMHSFMHFFMCRHARLQCRHALFHAGMFSEGEALPVAYFYKRSGAEEGNEHTPQGALASRHVHTHTLMHACTHAHSDTVHNTNIMYMQRRGKGETRGGACTNVKRIGVKRKVIHAICRVAVREESNDFF